MEIKQTYLGLCATRRKGGVYSAINQQSGVYIAPACKFSSFFIRPILLLECSNHMMVQSLTCKNASPIYKYLIPKGRLLLSKLTVSQSSRNFSLLLIMRVQQRVLKNPLMVPITGQMNVFLLLKTDFQKYNLVFPFLFSLCPQIGLCRSRHCNENINFNKTYLKMNIVPRYAHIKTQTPNITARKTQTQAHTLRTKN